MEKRTGYNPEAPVFLGRTNVNLARTQRGCNFALFITVFGIDIVSALVGYQSLNYTFIHILVIFWRGHQITLEVDFLVPSFQQLCRCLITSAGASNLIKVSYSQDRF